MNYVADCDRDAARQQPWSLHDFLTAALLHRIAIVRLGVSLALLVGLLTILSPKMYTSRAVLATPISALSPTGIGGLAAQLGLGLAMPGGSRPPAFFINLARSETVRKSIVQKIYAYQDADSLCRCDLVGYLVGDVTPRPLAVELAATELRGRISASLSKEAGTIEIAARFDDPVLAQQVVTNILSELDQFTVRERLEHAMAERQFLEGRLAPARAAQRESEDALEQFLVDNRDFRNSPALQARFERLNREVVLRQELTASIRSGYESARLEENRNTGVLVLVTPASLAAQRDPRFLIVKVLGAALLGVAIGVGLAWAREVVRRPSLSGYSAEVALAVRADTLAELRRPWRLLGLSAP